MSRTLFQALTVCIAMACSTATLAKVEVQAAQHKTLGRILLAKVAEDIAVGDYEILLKGISSNPGQYARKIIMLDSIGGSVDEAIRMGRLLRETGFETLVPSTGVCQGSCVYLLAAGQRKKVRGSVGIHRPYYVGSDSVHSTSREGTVKSNQVAYFKEMKIPLELLDVINRTEPQRMRVLTPVELARFGLN